MNYFTKIILCKDESKVLQCFGNVKHNSAVLDAFVKVEKLTLDCEMLILSYNLDSHSYFPNMLLYISEFCNHQICIKNYNLVDGDKILQYLQSFKNKLLELEGN